MADPATLQDLDQRIAVIRDNLRELTEQAAAFSGAEDEARAADRIAEQQQALETLLKEREALEKIARPQVLRRVLAGKVAAKPPEGCGRCLAAVGLPGVRRTQPRTHRGEGDSPAPASLMTGVRPSRFSRASYSRGLHLFVHALAPSSRPCQIGVLRGEIAQ